MYKQLIIPKSIKRSFHYQLIGGVVILSLSSIVSAQSQEEGAEVSTAAEFDSSFLIGDAKKIDVKKFANGNPILAGDYNLDIYINGTWYGKRLVTFVATKNDESAYTCFTAKQLLEYGVRAEIIKERLQTNKNDCRTLNEWLDDSFYKFDTSKLRLDVSIPQIAMQQNARGYIDPSLWDRGINAGFVSYNINTYKSFNNESDKDTTNAFLTLNTGANIASWQLRHNGQWTWSDDKEADDSKSTYTSVSTYAQRAFPKYKGVLTLGDSFSNGNIFDSYGYRGVEFSTDDRMLPNSQTGYAPRIRGNAKTNAKVEVRQQGQLIYQTTVAPGGFEINDLNPTGFGGELEVSVIEADGEVQKFNIPYASVAELLRPGLSRYSLMLGQYRNTDVEKDPMLLQAQYQRGINNYVTAYGGIQGSEYYQAASLGSAVATPIGAIALDVTHSNTDFENRESESGQSYRLSYSKRFNPTNTNVTLAAYRYSTEGFYKLNDAMRAQEQDEQGIGSAYIGKQRSEFQVTLNQGLPNQWGNFYLTGSWADYWHNQQDTKSYQIGYNNSYRGINYGLSANKRVVENSLTGKQSDDTEYMLTLSLPVSIAGRPASLNTYSTKDSSTVGLNGSIGERFNYGTTVVADYGDNPSLSTNAEYKANMVTIGGFYNVSDSYQQVGLSARGNIVAHSKGVVFGPDQGQTMVLVYAPDAEGAKVTNSTGLTINKSGYAVIPYVTPYRLNDISLDPKGMSLDTELQSTSQHIAPYAGSISRVDFSTKSGKALYIHALNSKGETLPFGADVFDSKGEQIGMIAQGSLAYIRTKQRFDTITVKWGAEATEQCQIDYDIRNQSNDNKNMTMLDGVCHEL